MMTGMFGVPANVSLGGLPYPKYILSCCSSISVMVNVLKFCIQNFICKQCRPRSDCSRRSSLIRVYTICHSTKYFQKQLHRKQKLGHKRME